MNRFKLYTMITSVLLLIAGCNNDKASHGGSGLMETTEVIVSAETGGRLITINFDEGDRVEAGDTIAVIDPTRIELQLDAARAGLKVAQANLETARIQKERADETEAFAAREKQRLEKLLKSGTATRRQYDKVAHEYDQAVLAVKTAAAQISTVEAELDKIRAEIATLEQQLDDSYPQAPVSGTVAEKYRDAGELAAPGKPLIKIARLDTLWVKVYLPTGQFARVKLGDSATVDTESGETSYRGEVVRTADEAEFTPKNVQTAESRANLVYAVKVEVPNTDGRLKVGMPVFVILESLNEQ